MEIQFHNKKRRASGKVSFAKIDGKRTSQVKAHAELAKFKSPTPESVTETEDYTILTYKSTRPD